MYVFLESLDCKLPYLSHNRIFADVSIKDPPQHFNSLSIPLLVQMVPYKPRLLDNVNFSI